MNSVSSLSGATRGPHLLLLFFFCVLLGRVFATASRRVLLLWGSVIDSAGSASAPLRLFPATCVRQYQVHPSIGLASAH